MIHDKNLIHEFYETIVPELTEDEVMFVFMQARRKYNKTLRISEHDPILMRKTIKYNEYPLFINKIEQLDAVSNVAISYSSHDPLPKDAMVIYIDINPKSTIKAFQAMTSFYIGEFDNIIRHNQWDLIKRIDSKLNTFIHKSNSRKPYFMIDIDTKEDNSLDKILDFPIHNAIDWITETRGGYHILLNKRGDNANKIGKIVYKDIIPKYPKIVDQVAKAPMTVLPGIIQGGWKTRRIEL